MQKSLISKVFILLLVVGLLFAAAPTKQAQALTPTTLNVAQWSATAPVGVAGRPSVLFDGTTYHMWYGVDLAGGVTELYYTTSTTPGSFSAGTKVTFNTAPLEQSSVTVIKEADGFKMIAYGLDNKTFALYTSSDGLAWTKGATVFDATGMTDLGKIDAPFVFNDGGTFKLYFQKKSVDGQSYKIYLATSATVVGTYALANSGNPVLSPNTDITAWDGKFVMHPWVVKDGATYYMYYSAHNSVVTQQIGLATSPDGINWTKSPANPVIGPTGEPSVIKIGDTWHMWYLGSGNAVQYVSATGPFEFQTIQAAVAASAAGDVINVAPGTYVEVGQIVIDKNLTIVGADKATTIIKPAQNTGNSGDARGWWLVQSGVQFNLSNVTLDGAGKLVSIGILSHGTGTIENNIIKNIGYNPSGPDYAGRGIAIYDADMTIKDNLLQNIGRIGIYVYGANADLVVIDGNTYEGKGAGNWLDYGVEIEGGAKAEVKNNLIKNCSGIATVDDSGSAGLLITTYFAPGAAANIHDNVFDSNSTGISVGYDASDISSVVVGYNKLLNNEYAITTTAPAVNGSPNWFGQATGPASGDLYGDISYLPYCTNAECTTFSQAALYMTPATTEMTCGGTNYVVDVMVKDVVDLQAYELKLQFDHTRIQIISVENGGFLAAPGTASPGNDLGNDDGLMTWGWYPTGVRQIDGSGSLIKITFRPTNIAGTSAFTILPTSALENWPNAFSIPFSVTGGATVTTGSIVTNTKSTVETADDVSYCDLAVAVAQAAGGDTLRADVDITSNVSITVDKALTLDTNGKTISRTVALTNNNSFVVVPGGDLTITGAGTITSNSGNAIRIEGNETTQAKVTLVNATLYGPNTSVSIIGNRSYTAHEPAYKSLFVMTGGYTNETVLLLGNGAEADITGGTLTGLAPIMGNGTVDALTNINNGGTKITIGGTAVVNGGTVLAIYHPQEGLLTINGNATITGTNGIEMKAGDLVVTGGTIQGTATTCAEPTATGSGSTDTGDAILIFNRDTYGAGQTMDVTISGTPTITSNCYALREFTLTGETSRLGVAAISGGHFTGGTLGAVSFTTVSDANLDLTAGDYSTDPIAFVYTPYGTSLHTDARWYISLLPVLSSSTFDDQVTLGVATTFDLTVNPSVPGDFNMVFTGYPSETQITYLGTTYYCVGSPCVITVPVTLTGASQTLPFAITVATSGTETPAATYAVTATLHAPAPAYGTTGRDLAALSATVPVTPGFTVSGTVTMQGRTTRAGVPVYLTWNNTLGVTYGPSMNTDEQAVNFRLAVNYGGTYTITTLQPRFLNITTDLAKTITVNANYTFANPLWLRAGNAIWRNPSTGAYDNTIGVTDAQKVLDAWATTGMTDTFDNSGDVNFDNIVSIKDLTLVGGNMDLTSATAYGTWMP